MSHIWQACPVGAQALDFPSLFLPPSQAAGLGLPAFGCSVGCTPSACSWRQRGVAAVLSGGGVFLALAGVCMGKHRSVTGYRKIQGRVPVGEAHPAGHAPQSPILLSQQLDSPCPCPCS